MKGGRGMADSNPYQPYFTAVDRISIALAEGELTREDRAEAIDLFRRGVFVLANLLSVQAQVYPMLFIPADAPETGDSDTEGTSLAVEEAAVD